MKDEYVVDIESRKIIAWDKKILQVLNNDALEKQNRGEEV